MDRFGLFLLAFSIIPVFGLSTSSYLGVSEQEHLTNILDSAWKLNDVSQVFYGVGGYQYLGLNVPKKENVCTFIKQSVKAGASMEDIFFAATIGKTLGCPVKAPANTKQDITDMLRDGASLQDLFHAVGAASNLGLELDNGKALRAVQQGLKKDDSVLSLGYAFHIGSQLKGDMSSIFERIEDAIVQADEVDGHMLQFEGGLSITALVLSGAYRLSDSSKKPIPIKEEQVVKFSNYLMSRKSVQMAKGVYYLLDAVSMLTNNKYHIPVSITLASSVAVSLDSPAIQVRVTNLMGSDLKSLKVVAASATETTSGKSILSNKPFTLVKGEKSVYELNIMALKPSRGFYTLSLNAEGSDSRFVGNLGATLTFKVLSSIAIQDVEIGTADADQSTAPSLKRVHYPKMLDEVLEADQHQKIMLKFFIKDVAADIFTKVHQAFVKVTHAASHREIIFIAESDPSGGYKFDMDVNGKQKEFGGMSGKYSLELIIGDASISNPIVWHVSDVVLSFPDSTTEEVDADFTYKAKPEIHHLFHSPEPRPAKIVSFAFTALCLSPLLILLIGWAKLGVNISNIPMSLATVGFHLGLGAIFALFGMFFLELNMFTTLRYLFMIGVVTFFCGNSMLSTIAGRRKEAKS